MLLQGKYDVEDILIFHSKKFQIISHHWSKKKVKVSFFKSGFKSNLEIQSFFHHGLNTRKKRPCIHTCQNLSNDTIIKRDLIDVNITNKQIKKENINFVLSSVNGECSILYIKADNLCYMKSKENIILILRCLNFLMIGRKFTKKLKMIV